MDEKKKSASRPRAEGAKKPYRRPKLTRYGNLKDLTASSVSLGTDLSIPGTFQMGS